MLSEFAQNILPVDEDIGQLWGRLRVPHPEHALDKLIAATGLIHDLIVVTRDGCVNTPDMVNNLDDALKAIKLRTDYQFINIDKLPKSDVRTGYPTPTILWKGRDIFGMPIPKPPYDVPS